MQTTTLNPPSADQRGLLTAKIYYFCLFGAVGALLPFLNVYFERNGLTGAQIGWLTGIPPLLIIAVNPLWGLAGDRWRARRLALASCALFAGLCTLAIPWVVSLPLLAVAVFGSALSRAPLISIMDSATMGLVTRTGSSYGRQRLWGSVGFILASYGLGLLLSADLRPIFWSAGLLMGVGCAALSLLLPPSVDRPPSDETAGALAGATAASNMASTVESEADAATGSLLPTDALDWREMSRQVRTLLSQRIYLVFLFTAVLQSAGFAAYSGYLGLRILEMGGSEATVGLAWALNAVAEIPIMYFGARWFAAFSTERLLLLGLLCYAFVWSAIALAPSPVWIVAAASLHGIAFAIYWVAVVEFADRAAPQSLSATSQSLLSAAQGGIGSSLGALGAGYLWGWTNAATVLGAAAISAALGALLFAWAIRR